MTLIIAIAAVLILGAVRARWVLYNNDRYAIMASWYCWRTKQGVLALEEMNQRWGVSFQFCEIWRWDFCRYVVDQERYDAMQTFIEAELKRDDIDWAMLAESQLPPVDEPTETPPTQ